MALRISLQRDLVECVTMGDVSRIHIPLRLSRMKYYFDLQRNDLHSHNLLKRSRPHSHVV